MTRIARTILALLTCLALPAASFAHEGHEHPSPTKFSKTRYAWGVQGDPRKATKTVTVEMSDTMRFSPDRLEVKAGDTVKFVVRNAGAQMHEMVIGTEKALREHAEAMKRHPAMEHEEPYMAHVSPGGARAITWTFTEPGTYMFACLVPGHFEAGMKGTIVVAGKPPGQ
jgi:uncharacterized cupredoxin-like copper-binding protein